MWRPRVHVAHRIGGFKSNTCVLSGQMWGSWRQGGSQSKWAGIIPLRWRWRRSLTRSWWPEILQAGFTVKGFSALWEAYLLASFAPLHLVFPSCNLPPHFLPSFQPPVPARPPLHTFLVLLPACCSPLSLSEPEEWGWQVHGWKEGGRRGRWERGRKRVAKLQNIGLILITERKTFKKSEAQPSFSCFDYLTVKTFDGTKNAQDV